mgnify:CR=1 FL=1
MKHRIGKKYWTHISRHSLRKLPNFRPPSGQPCSPRLIHPSRNRPSLPDSVPYTGIEENGERREAGTDAGEEGENGGSTDSEAGADAETVEDKGREADAETVEDRGRGADAGTVGDRGTGVDAGIASFSPLTVFFYAGVFFIFAVRYINHSHIPIFGHCHIMNPSTFCPPFLAWLTVFGLISGMGGLFGCGGTGNTGEEKDSVKSSLEGEGVKPENGLDDGKVTIFGHCHIMNPSTFCPPFLIPCHLLPLPCHTIIPGHIFPGIP